MFTEDELIKKKDIFDPIEDDDDIDWKYNPFDVDLIARPDLGTVPPATVSPSSCCSSHFATSLLTNEV